MTIELGNRLSDLRKKKGLSQEQLADQLGVSRQAISKWECGESSPDTDNLIELSKIYGVSLDELVGNAPKKEVEAEVIDEDKKCECDGDDDDHDEDEEEEKKHPKFVIVNTIISSVLILGIVITYVLLGTYLGLWGKAWTLFLLIPVIPSFMEAIVYKNPSKFLYPLFI